MPTLPPLDRFILYSTHSSIVPHGDGEVIAMAFATNPTFRFSRPRSTPIGTVEATRFSSVIIVHKL